MRKAIFVASLMLAGLSAQGATITTLFAGGNGQDGSMFNIQNISSDNITLLGTFRVNSEVSAGNSADFEIWTRTGTYAGFELSSTGWTQLGTTQTVTSAGTNNPTSLNVGATLVLAPGQTIGFYVYTPQGLNYTDTGTNGALGTYSDGVLRLDLGVGVGNGRFSGSTFTPRTANISIDYTQGGSPEVPEPSTALLMLGGVGMAAWLRRRMA